MRRDLQRRMQQLEQALQLPVANQPQLIMIYGGLPGDSLHATVGHLFLEAEPDELLENFKERVIEAAAEVRVPFAVIGGVTRWPR
jgi:hypothetical protein